MTKLISVRDEVYQMLSALKHQGESFSQLFIRLTDKSSNRSIMEFAGVWKDWDEADEIFAKILERRSVRRRRVVL